MKTISLAVMCFLVAGTFLAQGCKSGSSTTGAAQQANQSSGTQAENANSPAVTRAAAPANPSAARMSWSKIEGIEGLPAEAYIDVGRLSCTPDGNVQVWQKFVYPKGSSARLSSMTYLKENGRSYENYG